MSEAAQSRPSLARVHTRASETKRNSALDEGIRIIKDGEAFEVRIGDVTPALEADLRRHSGMGLFKLLTVCGEDPGSDVLTAFEWLARRIRDEQVEFEDVEFSFADILSDGFDVASAGDPTDNDSDADPQT